MANSLCVCVSVHVCVEGLCGLWSNYEVYENMESMSKIIKTKLHYNLCTLTIL